MAEEAPWTSQRAEETAGSHSRNDDIRERPVRQKYVNDRLDGRLTTSAASSLKKYGSAYQRPDIHPLDERKEEVWHHP